ncbi:Retrovirus-related Pol poly from transposon [Labeo rohita]|uniref:Retrovirus-related Pol poly from transposon n=1 Tax=Labeo rohita TaxID=84645 RepID=A0A498LJZ5_LABRO|nr:Retrovirus-related Pol poly from transposon [Labeo rohita]
MHHSTVWELCYSSSMMTYGSQWPTGPERYLLQKQGERCVVMHGGFKRCLASKGSPTFRMQQAPSSDPALRTCSKYTTSRCQTDWPNVIRESHRGGELDQCYVIVRIWIVKERMLDDLTRCPGRLIRFPEVMNIKDKTARTVTEKMKTVYARHGIPKELVCDHVPFASYEMKKFAAEWGIKTRESGLVKSVTFHYLHVLQASLSIQIALTDM